MKHTVYLLPLIMLLLAFWLRVDNLAQMPPGMSNDESIYLIDTFNTSRGGAFTFFEHGRPEPGFQLILSTTTRFFGADPFVVRLTPIFLSLLTLAVVYWATLQVLYDLPSLHRHISALIASGALATSLGFITLSRAIERGVPQVLFMALFIGALALCLRTRRWRDVLIAGVALAGTIYFYTAGLVMPAVLAPIGFVLFFFHSTTWKKWLSRFIGISLVTVLLTLPCGLTLLINPSLILDRAGDVVGAGFSLADGISLTWGHLLSAGDPNSQYNTASMPMILTAFQPFFVLGLFMLLIRIKHPASIAIFTFLILGALTPLLTNEPIHGIRAIGMFGAFPFIIGLGVALVLWTVERVLSSRMRPMWLIMGVGLIGISAIQANAIYADYWRNPPLTRVYVDELTVGEWYFRQDRRDVARWLMSQTRPVLLPMDELNQPTMRAWTINHIPNLRTVDDGFVLPSDTLLFLPWQIETLDIRKTTRLYALVDDDTITLLPPFSEHTHQQLLEIGQNGREFIREDGAYLRFMGYLADLPKDFIAIYTDTPVTSDTPLAQFSNNTVQIIAWHGMDTIQGYVGEELTYFVQWQGEQLDQRYHTVLQLHTQNADNKASAADISLAYIYPQTIWDEALSPYIEYPLILSEDLPYGAYRLVAGIYDFKTRTNLPAISLIGHPMETLATIGWIKVPHPPMTMPLGTRQLDVILGDAIGLYGVYIQQETSDMLQIQLAWEAITQRPNFDATLFIHIYAGDERIGQIDTRPLDGQYPTFIWDSGELVITEHAISLDGVLSTGGYLLVGMYTFPTLERLSVMQDGVLQADNVVRIMLDD